MWPSTSSNPMVPTVGLIVLGPCVYSSYDISLLRLVQESSSIIVQLCSTLQPDGVLNRAAHHFTPLGGHVAKTFNHAEDASPVCTLGLFSFLAFHMFRYAHMLRVILDLRIPMPLKPIESLMLLYVEHAQCWAAMNEWEHNSILRDTRSPFLGIVAHQFYSMVDL